MSGVADLMETAGCLCLASRRTARAITRRFDQKLRAHGLRATQFTLLATLELKGPQRIGDLAEFIVADRTTMTRNVSVAEDKGLVEVRRAERDARSRVVAITPSGRSALLAAFETWREVQANLLGTVGVEAAEGLRRLGGGPALKRTVGNDNNVQQEQPR